MTKVSAHSALFNALELQQQRLRRGMDHPGHMITFRTHGIHQVMLDAPLLLSALRRNLQQLLSLLSLHR
eukprot:6456783-Amphidinium_carterae.2